MACFKKTIWFCFIFFVLYAVFSQVEATQCKSDRDCSTRECCDSGNNCDVVCYEGSKTPSTALIRVLALIISALCFLCCGCYCCNTKSTTASRPESARQFATTTTIDLSTEQQRRQSPAQEEQPLHILDPRELPNQLPPYSSQPPSPYPNQLPPYPNQPPPYPNQPSPPYPNQLQPYPNQPPPPYPNQPPPYSTLPSTRCEPPGSISPPSYRSQDTSPESSDPPVEMTPHVYVNVIFRDRDITDT